jgi:hypothetical protein
MPRRQDGEYAGQPLQDLEWENSSPPVARGKSPAIEGYRTAAK